MEQLKTSSWFRMLYISRLKTKKNSKQAAHHMTETSDSNVPLDPGGLCGRSWTGQWVNVFCS